LNIATGNGANASGDGGSNIAIGASANANGAGSNNTAVGASSVATGANSSAFGNGASAGFANSAAIGNGATATRANQQVFGTASNTYTMGGITSGASAAAQSGPTQIVTSDAGGNLATTTLAGLGLASMGDINAINSQLAGINNRLDDLTLRSNKAYSGVAMAFAMAGVPTLMPNESFAMTMNWGTFQSANGLALNAAVRVDNHVQLNAGFGYGPDQRIGGGRVGVRVGW
jgi:autotransporter adhesin